MLRLRDDRPITRNVGELRTLARVVLEQGERRGLLAFGAADDHLHAELATDRATAGFFAHYVASSLRWRLGLGVPFERARIRPLADQRHAYNTFHYVQRQDTRHEVGRDLFREATSLPDLLGLRVCASGITRRVREHLPRIDRRALLAHLPVYARDDGSEALDERTGLPTRLDLLAEAACAAFALHDLRGRSPDACRARRAAVHAAGPSACSREVAEHLGIGTRALQSLRAQPIDETAIRAVTLQLRLRAAMQPGARDESA